MRLGTHRTASVLFLLLFFISRLWCDDTGRTIRAITILGNKYIPTQAIQAQIPYQIGEPFEPQKSNSLIHNVYSLGYFNQINVMGQDIGTDQMDLFVFIQEKPRLAKVTFEGNNCLSQKEINDEIHFDDIVAIDPSELSHYVTRLKKLYTQKDYHFVDIDPVVELDGDNLSVTFKICEHEKSFVKRVFFKGNRCLSSKLLRKSIFTREDWLLGFLDKSGSYQPDMVETDKMRLEYVYQNNGFLTARVTDAQVVCDPATKQFTVTFEVQEGEKFTVCDIKAPGHGHITQEFILSRLPIKPGDLYSKEKITESIEMLRLIWGEQGYLFADIEPSIEPDMDAKTVSISFFSDLGQPVFLNRLTIIGNEKTRDYVIRRQLSLNEGELITNRRMDESKMGVEGLGYFDRKEGVNWKITRIADDLADLDLLVKEVKTGSLGAQLGLGGSIKDITDPSRSVKLSTFVHDTNLWGKGITLNLMGEISKEEQTVQVTLADPWLFDRPLSGALDAYYRRSDYSDEIRNTDGGVNERLIGGSGTLGYLIPLFGRTVFTCQASMQNIDFPCKPVASKTLSIEEQIEFQSILNRRFQDGNLAWVQATFSQDLRNHPIHPSKGYQWALLNKVGLSGGNSTFGFFKFEFDTSYYTPLIGQDSLILGMHAHIGIVGQFKNHTIPYRELYHVGGPATVRGYLWGQIGPMWRASSLPGCVDSIGAKKAFWINTDLIFPITPDFSVKGSVFYDGGAGWDTPDAQLIDPARLFNNRFNYRHSVGIGIRLRNPTPMRIDWGFKLDRNKRLNEPVSEVHFGVYHEF